MRREMFQTISRYVDVAETVLLSGDSNLSKNNENIFKQFLNIITKLEGFHLVTEIPLRCL